MASLYTMGPAILNGGITTFLALVLLGFSNSHPFITFFKVSPKLEANQFENDLPALILSCT